MNNHYLLSTAAIQEAVKDLVAAMDMVAMIEKTVLNNQLIVLNRNRYQFSGALYETLKAHGIQFPAYVNSPNELYLLDDKSLKEFRLDCETLNAVDGISPTFPGVCPLEQARQHVSNKKMELVRLIKSTSDFDESRMLINSVLFPEDNSNILLRLLYSNTPKITLN